MTSASLHREIKQYFKTLKPKNSFDFPKQHHTIDTGVLVPLIIGAEVQCILTKRSPTLSSHPGEISFPGGTRETSDLNLEHTAVREANEELGIENPTIFGTLSSVPLYTSNFRLVPFVAEIQNLNFTPNLVEVAKVLHISIQSILKQNTIESVEWKKGIESYATPIFETDSEIIFGGTARVLHELVHHFSTILGVPMPPTVHSPLALQKLKKWKSVQKKDTKRK